MASRSNIEPGIVAAQLDGRARYLLEHQIPRHDALEDLRSIGAPADLIAETAASRRAWYEQRPEPGRAQYLEVADLLDALLEPTP
ncbi:hypothetical protein HZF07_00090 [Nocardioides sp. CGMCC 1.13656]|uniref:hypothetical protein n=1 Tax=Nocardioides TaxID=1839 RepID=UPI0012FA8020|nr:MULTISPECIES: hypothetical protein [unclassified Nocardioides]MBA2952089.1 hypothetical protein [Nocardioides sp. CGMCC 1.13656]